MSGRTNPTGFDARKLAAAAGPKSDDPWARREAWRSTGPFTRRNRLRGMLPGFGWGAGAFALYMVYETFFMSKDHAAHQDSHGITT